MFEMILPLELHDQYLWDDNKALSACSITVCTFTVPIQMCLFSRIIIRGPSKHTSPVQDIGGSSPNFKLLLESSPHIASYMDYLEIFDLKRTYRSNSKVFIEEATREE